jgi:hypothetical protein
MHSWLRHNENGYSLASYFGGPGSRPGVSSGICGGQRGAGAGFLRAFRFPLSIFILQNSPSSQSPEAGTIGEKWPTCRVGPVWAPIPSMRIKKK